VNCFTWVVVLSSSLLHANGFTPSVTFSRSGVQQIAFDSTHRRSVHRTFLHPFPQVQSRAPTRLFSTSTSLPEDDFVAAQDLEALQELFTKYCDKDGLMDKNAAMKVPAIAELLVRFCFFTVTILTIAQSVKNRIGSRITPRQCRTAR
jgi:hypothetical protein